MDFLLHLDQKMFLFLNGLHCGFLDPVMWYISGKISWLPLYAVIIYFIIKERKQNFWIPLIIIALMIVCSDQVSDLIKDSVQRLRPTHNPLISNLVHVLKDSHGNEYRGGSFGYVSSHAANSFAVAAFVSLFFVRRWVSIFIICWACIVSYSRIYLGVHYPLDIICGGILGACIGTTMAYLDRAIIKKIKARKKQQTVSPENLIHNHCNLPLHMNSRSVINLFLDDRNIAIAGVSRDKKKFGYLIFKTLKEKGYHVTPINPNTDTIDDVPCFRSIQAIPSSINNLLIVTHKHQTKAAVQAAIHKGIKNIWIQNGCETEEAIQLAKDNNINLVAKACILMYADPKGFHKFHQVLAKVFGQYVS